MAKVKQHKQFKVNRQQRRERRNKRLMSIILTAVMVLAVGGVIAANQGSNSTDFQYNGYRFTYEPLPEVNNNYVYTTKQNGQGLFFYSLPAQASRINTTGNLTKLLAPASYIALTTEPSVEYASLYDVIRFELSRLSGKLIMGGTLVENENLTAEVLTCQNATADFPVIELRSTENSTNIIVQDNCAVIFSQPQQLSLIRDRLLYSMTGIIQK